MMAVWPWLLILPSLVLHWYFTGASLVLATDKGPSVRHCKDSTKGIDWDCTNRNLQGVPYDVFDNREIIKLGNNPFMCDCSMVWFMREMENAMMYIKDLANLTCSKPNEQATKKIKDLKERDVCNPEFLFSRTKCRKYLSFKLLECSPTTTSNRIPFDLFKEPLDDIKHIDMAGSYHCDCNIVWFIRKIRQQKFVDRIYPDTITCLEHGTWQPKRIARLTEQQVCPQKAPDVCNTKPPPCNIKYSTCKNTNIGSFKCIDIDECAEGSYECSEGEECVNNVNGYMCKCMPGHEKGKSGRGCIVPENPCVVTPSPCNKTTQVCVRGKKLGSYQCEDVLPCSGRLTCAVHAKCVFRKGRSQCVCKAGYHGNGKVCKDINECTANIHTCDKNALCTNSLGGYKCRCKKGFKNLKNGRLCVKKEEKSSFTVLILISIGAGCFFILILWITICVYLRKKTKKSKVEEQTDLLLQQQNLQEQMFAFNGGFTDPNNVIQIHANQSTMTNFTLWSDDEDDDYDEGPEFDTKSSTSKKQIRWNSES